ncbi:hypothetical protein AD998_03390 [bacterium 336/3]|nr:hypothetical protein AD998_03390 [bacterium 336/3]
MFHFNKPYIMLHSYLNFYKKTSWLLTLIIVLSGTSIKAQVLLNEGFEGTTFVPTGWSSGNALVSGTGTGSSTYFTRITTPTAGAGCTGTSTGAAQIRYGITTGTLDSYLATPSLVIPAGGASTSLTFCETEQYTGSFGSVFSVRVSTSPITTSNVGSATVVYTRNENNGTTYTSRTVDLTSYAGQTIYLAFVNRNLDGDTWRLDNINVTAILPPDINVLGTDNSSIATGTTTTSVTNGTNYGTFSVASGTAIERIFTIQNTGSINLTLGTITSSNSNFTITQQATSPVIPAGSTTFRIRFAPGTFGTFNSTISIPNNDPNENPYTFAITGTATSPEINIVGLGNNISNNKFLTTTTDGTFLGVVTGSATSLSSTFTIQNAGNESLTISSVSMRRGSSSAFSVANVPTSIAAAGSADFTISYDVSKGAQMDTVAIASNDGDESVYRFTVSAGGVVASLDNNLADGNLLITPNPSSKNFNIKIGGAKYTSVHAVVYDMAGRAVKTQNNAQFSGSMDIDLGNLEKGTYILMLETGGEKVARKLIKQ